MKNVIMSIFGSICGLHLLFAGWAASFWWIGTRNQREPHDCWTIIGCLYNLYSVPMFIWACIIGLFVGVCLQITKK